MGISASAMAFELPFFSSFVMFESSRMLFSSRCRNELGRCQSRRFDQYSHLWNWFSAAFSFSFIVFFCLRIRGVLGSTASARLFAVDGLWVQRRNAGVMLAGLGEG